MYWGILAVLCDVWRKLCWMNDERVHGAMMKAGEGYDVGLSLGLQVQAMVPRAGTVPVPA